MKRDIKIARILLASIILTAVAVAIYIQARSQNSQRLGDGSLLTLTRLRYGSDVCFYHGTLLEKSLGNLIPSNGVHLASLQLERPLRRRFNSPDKNTLVAEFNLSGPNATNHPLAKPGSFHKCRAVIYGERGIEFVHELNQFAHHKDGLFTYVSSTRFPRDSAWLGFRIETTDRANPPGRWTTIADFKTKNPATMVLQPWTTNSAPTVFSTNGLEFAVRAITVVTNELAPRDIWNHLVTLSTEVRSNGVPLKNWSPSYVQAEDASGNWDYFQSHRSLDPRFIWKLDIDFEPDSNFSPESLATIQLSARSMSLTTNVQNVPVTVNDGPWIDAAIPANNPGVALKFIDAFNQENRRTRLSSGSWSQYSFRKGSFFFQTSSNMVAQFAPTKITIAVVPNIHCTFYVQPRLASDPVADELSKLLQLGESEQK